jgi:hypothetical protein
MNHSGDAAEQIVRMSLDGVEVAARITGTAAKEIALLLLAALKSPEKGAGGLKTKGRARLESMLKSGKALEIFSVKESDLRTFVQEAKNYGIVYCALRGGKNTPDGLCDIMVKADDAPKINRIVERFKFAAVDKAKIESEIIRDMEAKGEPAADTTAQPKADGEIAPADVPGEPKAPEINDIDALLDELLGTGEGRAAPEAGKAEPGKAADTPVPGSPGKTTPEPEKTEPAKTAPKKAGRGAKKEPAPEPITEEEPDPLASGGDSPTAAVNSPSPSDPPPKTSPSEPSSGNRKHSERHTLSKPSVKEELREIKAAQKAKESEARKRGEPAADKPKETRASAHRQPQTRRKPKSRKER